MVEIMVNPDGALRLDRLGEGRVDTEVRLAPDQVERIIRLVASHARAEVHAEHPIISAELPPHIEGRAGERFEGVLPPVATAPCFSIRKPAQKLHTLDDYIADGLMSERQADELRAAVAQRFNILVAGGTSSGKTTLANALLAEMAWVDSRVILIEDTRELQCPLPDAVALRTRPPHITMTDLVRSTIRVRRAPIKPLLLAEAGSIWTALSDGEDLLRRADLHERRKSLPPYVRLALDIEERSLDDLLGEIAQTYPHGWVGPHIDTAAIEAAATMLQASETVPLPYPLVQLVDDVPSARAAAIVMLGQPVRCD